jgi:hypothetical protein
MAGQFEFLSSRHNRSKFKLTLLLFRRSWRGRRLISERSLRGDLSISERSLRGDLSISERSLRGEFLLQNSSISETMQLTAEVKVRTPVDRYPDCPR